MRLNDGAGWPSDGGIRGRLLVILGALSAFAPISTDLYLPALPDAADDLGTSASGIQITLVVSMIGLGLGQLLMGPLSDRYGRRGPLLAGTAVFTVASLLCVLAPDVVLLAVFRFLQALGGSAGVVIGRAIVRDRVAGHRLVELFGVLTVVVSLAPIIAPLLGSAILLVGSWRTIFAALVVIGVLLAIATMLWVPETLAPEHRGIGGVLPGAFRSYRILLHDPRYIAVILTSAAAFGALFAYITGSPFALQTLHGLSPQMFSIVFGINGLCLMAGARWIRVGGPGLRIAVGAGFFTVATALLLIAAATDQLAVLLVAFATLSTGYGLIAPSTAALALMSHPERAGAAAALLGATQFVGGALAGSLVGHGAENSITGLVVVIGVSTAVTVVLAAVLNGGPGMRVGSPDPS